MKALINWLILFVTAVFLFVVLFPFGLIWTVFVAIWDGSLHKMLTYIGKMLRQIAVAIDQMGNVACRDLFNMTLINGDWYRFGKTDETISSVMGKNLKKWYTHNILSLDYKWKWKTKTIKAWYKSRVKKSPLTFAGITLVNILDWIDPNHCIKSIEILDCDDHQHVA